MSNHNNGLGVPLNDPRFFGSRADKPVKREGPPILGEMGIPVGETIDRFRHRAGGVLAEGAEGTGE